MSARKNAVPTITVHPRIPESLYQRIIQLKDSGPRIHDAEGTFLSYLIQLGAMHYANAILPAEMGDPPPMEPAARTAIEK